MPGRARLHALVAAFADVAAQRLRHDIRHSRYLRSGDRRPATGDRRPATGDRRPATANRQPTTDNRQPTTDNRQPEPLPNQTESPQPSTTAPHGLSPPNRSDRQPPLPLQSSCPASRASRSCWIFCSKSSSSAMSNGFDSNRAWTRRVRSNSSA
ncbi:response regulator [Burkholderia pseudomallei]|nr:response regulator [Burkholderia pseudomallei]